MHRERAKDGTVRIVGNPRELYPPGSIYMNLSNIDPAVYFGGVWSRFGKGRVLVGVDEDDGAFEEGGYEGGEASVALSVNEMPAHTHTVARRTTATTGSGFGTALGGATATTDLNSGSAGLGNAHNNLQPYITVFMWVRQS